MVQLTTLDKFGIVISQLAGGLSLASSICTALEAFGDWKEAASSRTIESSCIVTRLQAVLQIPLGIFSFLRLLGSFPASQPDQVWGGIGTTGTCTSQGVGLLFTTMLGIPLDMCLSLCYLLMIQYGWSEQKLRGMEIYFYVGIIPFALLLSGYSLVMKLFDFAHPTCFLAIPETCENEFDLEPTAEPSCVPTAPQLVGVRFVVFAVNMAHMLFSFYAMIRIYLVARRQRLRLKAKSNSNNVDPTQSSLPQESSPDSAEDYISKLVMLKGFLYASCVAVLQVPLALWAVLVLGGSQKELRALDFLVTVTIPLGGFLNMLVFLLGRRQMRTAYGRKARSLLDGAIAVLNGCFHGQCSCGTRGDSNNDDDERGQEEQVNDDI